MHGDNIHSSGLYYTYSKLSKILLIIYALQQSYEISSIVIYILQVKETETQKAKQFDKRHSKWQNCDINSVPFDNTFNVNVYI